MTLFYAYLKDSVYDPYWRYVIAFVNREAADEWWRLVSTPPSPYAANIKRLAPQFFIQSADKGNIVTFFSNTSLVDANKFLEKMFFTLLNDRDGRILSIAPPIKVTDHISGRWYFIRSQDDPDRHWYLRDSGACLVCGNAACDTVHVSTERRSRFFIQVRNSSIGEPQIPKDFVIIGSDQVSIATSSDQILRVNDAGELRATKSSQVPTPDTIFLFSDLKDRFVTRALKLVNGEVSEYVKVVERGSGEVFELSK